MCTNESHINDFATKSTFKTVHYLYLLTICNFIERKDAKTQSFFTYFASKSIKIFASLRLCVIN